MYDFDSGFRKGLILGLIIGVIGMVLILAF